MLDIETLTWDTNFFGFKIGCCNINNTVIFDADALVNVSKKMGYKLVYCTVAPDNIYANKALADAKIKLVDKKVTFIKNVATFNIPVNDNITNFTGNTVDAQLYKLALQSGIYSRFKTDENIPDGMFEKFYNTWIENSVLHGFADKTFVYTVDNQILGFVTLKCLQTQGAIGLIAVDSSARGQNIGSWLIAKCQNYLHTTGITKLLVVTQFDNQPAFNFYIKNGFIVHETQNIYHLWTK